jgi:hypothetical protein
MKSHQVTFYRLANCQSCNYTSYSVNIGKSVGPSAGSYCSKCGRPLSFTDVHEPFPGQEDIGKSMGYIKEVEGWIHKSSVN